MDLTKGNIIKVFYYTKSTIELSDKQKQENRTKGMSTQLETVLTKMMWGQADKQDLQSSVGKGYSMAKDLDKQDSFSINEIWLQVGHKETKHIIREIENNLNFVSWVDPMIIYDLKTI